MSDFLKGTPPRPGDRVRVTYDATVRKLDDHDRVMWVQQKAFPADFGVPEDATVEVLERAVPVCRAAEGATGIDCQLPRHHPLDVDHEGTHEPNESIDYPMFVRWPWQTYDPDYPADAGPAPMVLSAPDGQHVAELLVAGRKSDAVGVLAGVGWPHDRAKVFVESLPEYRTFLNHRPVKDVELPDVDAEPRVFRSDGPEPPDDVTVLTDSSESIPFLVRYGDHWRWTKNLGHPEHPSYTGGSWSYVTGEMERPVAFTEVSS